MELSNKMAPYKVHGLTIGVHIILFVPIGQHKSIASTIISTSELTLALANQTFLACYMQF